MGNFAENLNLGNRFRPPPPTQNFKSHISFACSCLTNASLFYFCMRGVNTRQESLIFKQNITPKTNLYE